jgi:hypothetical protein
VPQLARMTRESQTLRICTVENIGIKNGRVKNEGEDPMPPFVRLEGFRIVSSALVHHVDASHIRVFSSYDCLKCYHGVVILTLKNSHTL